MPDVKVRTNITKNIVKPDWIVDCVKDNRLLDYSKYLLYTNKNRSQPGIDFKPSVPKEEKPEVDHFTINLNTLNAKITNETIPETSTKVEKEETGTAVDPNFLQDFLKNSRLHHIATLGSSFKYHINDLRKNHDGKFPLREELKTKLKRSETSHEDQELVMHIDMDCFFVSVSIKNYPHLKGLPVAVTHSKGKSDSNSTEDFNSYAEIASCSYEARAKGLKNGMFVGAGMKLCPELKTIPYNFEEYKKTAFILYNTVAKYTLDIEAVSCDELYADLRSLLTECEVDLMDFVTMLRQEIFDQTGCTCSVGIGRNRLQARMATKAAKPNGQFELLSVNVEDYMKDQRIFDLPGVGPNTAYQLKQLKLETCDQLHNLPLQLLQQTFGKKFGETLQKMSRGHDEKKLVFEQVRKSVSVEVNYGIRFNEDHEVHVFMKQVTDELSKRLKEIHKKGKLLTLKLMVRAKDASVETIKFMGHGIIEKASKSVSLLASTDDSVTIHNHLLKLLSAFNVPPYELRGIGVQMSKLDEDKKDSKLLEMFKKAAEKHQNCDPEVNLELERLKSETSPKMKIIRSPLKKRGRPSKLATADKSNLTSIGDMFSVKKNSRTSFKRTVEMIDPEVLAELPPELVDEILKEYQVPNEENEEVEEPPTVIEENSIESISTEPSESSSENIFLQENWRSITKAWIDENNKSSRKTLEDDAAQLVRLKNIDLVYLVMKYLHRIIKDNGDISWQVLYQNVASEVQAEMLLTFRTKLAIPKDF